MHWALTAAVQKTDCVLMDETSTVLARTRSGPSNAINVGAEASAAALAEAGLQALRSIQKGARGHRIRFWLEFPALRSRNLDLRFNRAYSPHFPKPQSRLRAILVLCLGATGESPSVVIIAGTGSAVLGKTSKGFARARGGFGPIIGDPGSANDIGRKAASFCFQKFINSEKFLLTEEILKTFNCKWGPICRFSPRTTYDCIPADIPDCFALWQTRAIRQANLF